MITVRRGLQKDLPQLLQLTKDLAKETENGLVLDDALLTVGVGRGLSTTPDDAASPIYFVGIASSDQGDEQIVGFLAISPEWSDWWATWYWWVISVFVDANRRRQGVATLLFEAMQQEADTIGVQTVNLRVETANAAAQTFYHNIGFAIDDSHLVMSRGKTPSGKGIGGKDEGSGGGCGTGTGTGTGTGGGSDAAQATPPPPTATAADGTTEQKQWSLPSTDSKTITIFGYGSLLSEASCLRTCGSARNHRVAVIKGWERIFSLVSLSQLRNGNSNVDKHQIAAVAVRKSKDPTAQCVGVLFDIDEEDFEGIRQREHRYNIESVGAFDGADDTNSIDCIVFAESDDATYQSKCFQEGPHVHAQKFQGSNYTGPLWGRTDILPTTKYLLYCVNAASKLAFRGDSTMVRLNFLQALLADGVTTVGEYLERVAAPVQ